MCFCLVSFLALSIISTKMRCSSVNLNPVSISGAWNGCASSRQSCHPSHQLQIHLCLTGKCSDAEPPASGTPLSRDPVPRSHDALAAVQSFQNALIFIQLLTMGISDARKGAIILNGHIHRAESTIWILQHLVSFMFLYLLIPLFTILILWWISE